MATHLSESSVNSLLRFINHADNTGSYAEKVDLLKKSGILEGGNEYSSVVNKSTTINTKLKTVFFGANDVAQRVSVSVGRANDVAARLNLVADIVETAKKAYIAAGFGTDVDFAAEASRFLTSGEWMDGSYFSKALGIAVKELMSLNPDKASSYAQARNDVGSGKFPYLVRDAYAWLSDTAAAGYITTQITDAIAGMEAFGIDTQKIANDTSDKLTAFFVDGTYNFTYILFPTSVLQNGATGTGTSVISSNYDSYTKLLDKKAMINTFLTQPPQPSQIALQSFDITSTFMVMETYGSSLVGKFRIDGNKLQIKDYGFDATTGTFTNFQSVYLKTEIGYVVSNYNTDNGNLHSVWYYAIVPSPSSGTRPNLDQM